MSASAEAAAWVGSSISALSVSFLAYTRWSDSANAKREQARLIRVVATSSAAATATHLKGHVHNASESPIFSATLEVFKQEGDLKPAFTARQESIDPGKAGAEIAAHPTDVGWAAVWQATFVDAKGRRWRVGTNEEPTLVSERGKRRLYIEFR